jgi:hypothetical protein
MGPLIENQPIAFGGDAFLLSDQDGRGDEMTRHLFVRAIDLGRAYDMLAGYDQDMYGCLWPHVTEGQGVLILIHNIGGTLTGDDLAENTAHSDFPLQSSSLRRRNGFDEERVPRNTGRAYRRDRVGQYGRRLHLHPQIVVGQAGIEEPRF